MASTRTTTTKKAAPKKSPVKKATARKAAPVKKTTVKKAPAKKAPAKKAPVKKASVRKAAPVKKTTAKKAAPSKRAAAIAAVDQTAELSQEVLASIEGAQRSAISAIRSFVDTVDETIPAFGDRPSKRETVIDAALDMADKLVTAQYGFLRDLVRSADKSLTEKAAAAK